MLGVLSGHFDLSINFPFQVNLKKNQIEAELPFLAFQMTQVILEVSFITGTDVN